MFSVVVQENTFFVAYNENQFFKVEGAVQKFRTAILPLEIAVLFNEYLKDPLKVTKDLNSRDRRTQDFALKFSKFFKSLK